MPRDVDVSVRPDVAADAAALAAAVARAAGVSPDEVADLRVVRRALDARRGVRFQLRVRLFLHGESVEDAALPAPPVFPAPSRGLPVVVVGAGPAGLFAALRLAERGVPALVLERGKPVQARRRDLAALTKRGEVDPESNYCFGEGGAGTYSDGKLYTRSQKRGPVAAVLEQLVAHGADPAILVEARPHIGSNRLPRIVTALRETLARGGVETRFGARVVDLIVDGARIAGVRLADGSEIAVAAVVLATGHSARDVYAMATRAGLELDAKPFAVGVRVEHPQPLIDRAQYGADAERFRASRRVLSSGDDRPRARRLLVLHVPGRLDRPGDHRGRRGGGERHVARAPRLAVREQRHRRRARARGRRRARIRGRDRRRRAAGRARASRVRRRRRRAGGAGAASRSTSSPGETAAISPTARTCRASVRRGSISIFLPAIAERLRDALKRFGRQIRGYDTREAVVVGVETRSSSPVRIVRDPQTLASPSAANLYPCGEGAGYAGGIVSAALDGLAVADAAASAYVPGEAGRG